MTGPSPEALIAQLKELNERIRTYGRQIWQMSFAYVIASGAALSQLPGKDRLSPVVLPLALFAIGIVGIFTWRHLHGAVAAGHRSYEGIKDIERQLALDPGVTQWTPEHLEPLTTLTGLVALASLAGAAYLAYRLRG